ncbi:MAG: metallopeptidase family protein [Actinomycetaceae bacterium]|nr:metallopeptidase family protein [Actinomycetaceae bacterium]
MSHSRKRDRHGRGLRGPLFAPGTPARLTWREAFQQAIAWHAQDMVDRFPELAGIEIAIEDAPPSDPAPWEPRSKVMCRTFPADRAARLRPRVVLYRLPIHSRAGRASIRDPYGSAHTLIRSLLAEGLSDVSGIDPNALYGDFTY